MLLNVVIDVGTSMTRYPSLGIGFIVVNWKKYSALLLLINEFSL